MNFKGTFVSFPSCSNHDSSLYKFPFTESFIEKCGKHEYVFIKYALFASQS